MEQRAFITCNKNLKNVLDTARKIAVSDINVLITGENGVGKNALAQLIHSQSNRNKGPYVAVNCLALPESLIESALFGHVKGAFTDAKAAKKGSFEQAENGTLFLEEIGDITLAAQGKLLKAIEDKQFYRVGGENVFQSNARIISATNHDLEEGIQQRVFREDLFFRLKEVHFEIPPLRDRKEDIPLLLDHYLELFCLEQNKKKMRISNAAFGLLLNHDWPGNVRELRNAVRTAVILNDKDELWIENFPFSLQLKPDVACGENEENDVFLNTAIKRHIAIVLRAVGHNKSDAAKRLGISRPRLDRYIKSLYITFPH